VPMRDDGDAGVEIRYVYPKSAADTAKLKAGNRIMKIGRSPAPGQPAQMIPVKDRDQLLTLLETSSPNMEVKLEVKQDDKTNTVTVKLGPLPDDVPPDKLPVKDSFGKALGKPKDKPKEEKKDEKKDDEKKDDEKKGPETGLFKRTTTAQDRTLWMYVPKDYDPNVAHALVVWLHPAGKFKEADMQKLLDYGWDDYCSDNHLILVCPTTEAETGWAPGDTEFVQEAVKAATDGYTIDKRRVVAHGMGNGGQMAIYLGFHNRALYRGVAATGAALTGNPKERVANQPLAFFLSVGEKDPIKDAVKDSTEKLRENKFSVVHREMAKLGHEYLTEGTLQDLVRWIDSLDRM
jgi:serine protease Do